MCNFQEAWIGKCGSPVEPVCEKHADLKCVVCAASATHSCEETNGMCCGAPLCDSCEHALNKDGCNDGFRHVRKVDQKYKPWWEQELAAVSKGVES